MESALEAVPSTLIPSHILTEGLAVGDAHLNSVKCLTHKGQDA